jgi:copper(I)-binding protein
MLHRGLAAGLAAVLPAARACEFYTSTLRVTHPWTRATAPGASTAVVCMKFDEVTVADRLISVETPVATGAEMGGVGAGSAVDFLVPAGQTTFLDEGGTHVRLVGLKFPLEVGRSYPLRLGFEKGGEFNATLTVDYTRFK